MTPEGDQEKAYSNIEAAVEKLISCQKTREG
jgi:hypothetical protein